MTISFPEWFLYTLSAGIIIQAIANLVASYYEGRMKKMKSAVMGMEMAVRLGELDSDEIAKSIRKMVREKEAELRSE